MFLRIAFCSRLRRYSLLLCCASSVPLSEAGLSLDSPEFYFEIGATMSSIGLRLYLIMPVQRPKLLLRDGFYFYFASCYALMAHALSDSCYRTSSLVYLSSNCELLLVAPS